MVMVVATFMILASFVLVGASLSMSDHIDEMGELFCFSHQLNLIAMLQNDNYTLYVAFCSFRCKHKPLSQVKVLIL